MKIITWNVNGLRACLTKGFLDFFNEESPDIFCVQETKAQPHQIEMDTPGYHQYFYSAEKKGYSGTAIFTKEEPLTITYDFDEEGYDEEGRVMVFEYPSFYLVNAYVPNSKDGLARLAYRMDWEDKLRNKLMKLDKQKPVIYCGDLNVAHEEIDIKNPSTNHKNAGFSDEERAKFTQLLDAGFNDTYRTLYPSKVEYSWWSYRFNARKNNAGWRIDYFLVSNRIMKMVKKVHIYTDIEGSDHCPVGIEISVK